MLAAGRHEAQVIRGLSRALQQQTSQQLQQLRGRRVVVTPDRVCEVSSKPVGDRVFVVYPNSTLVLFGAASPADNVCPVTGRDFAQQPLEPEYEL